MAPTAADYLWFERDFPDLAEAYCITLVRGLAPKELLARLQGHPRAPLTGTAELVDSAYELGRDEQLIAMLGVGEWTLMIEPNGCLGVTEDTALPASAGTTWVSHFCNINGVDMFLWVEDTTTSLTFEPLFPDTRWGRVPDAQVDAMRRIGFPFSDSAAHIEQSVPATFALAEEISGVRLTPELIKSAVYTCGVVRVH